MIAISYRFLGAVVLRRGCGVNRGWRVLLATFFILWTSFSLGSSSPSVRECAIWVALSHLPWVDEGLLSLVQPYQPRLVQLAEQRAKASLGFGNNAPVTSLPRWDEIAETAEAYLSARSYGKALSDKVRARMARTMERGRPFEADLLPHLANQFLQKIARRSGNDEDSPFYQNTRLDGAIIVYLVGDLEAQERVFTEVMGQRLASLPLLLIVNESAPLLLQGEKRKQFLQRCSAIRYAPRGMNLIGSEINLNTGTIHLFAAESERGQVASLISQANRAVFRSTLNQNVSFIIDTTTLKLAPEWLSSSWPGDARRGFSFETVLEQISNRQEVQQLALYLTEDSLGSYNADFDLFYPKPIFGVSIAVAAYFTTIEESRRVLLFFREP